MLAGVEVDIKSNGLKLVLLDIFDGVEGLELNKSPPMVRATSQSFKMWNMAG
jgi:hypothetical protein